MKTKENKHGITIAIGEEIQAGLITLVVVKSTIRCEGCAFNDPNCRNIGSSVVGNCIGLLRTDHKNVIFKLKQ